ncbi:2-haloacid dehalogenase [Rhodobium orientis]|uniref:2-haloalkanoic acid dehalogenase n=1 Tax=Rhodobium orientis TaxID=34017 RepID=A0A327JS45_9HYPH|nr:HAD family phosphatase [Rhodobium orientis]MBB4304643.1 2-haloacid dehalogenase [Rhodobium orientis]MBK5950018.1 2-haloalkanoic acid dehalogenase [Rhodobium orientis]RAI27712.1 2-haloalkanoic acid dehalogenase [Rhodobium orientis]
MTETKIDTVIFDIGRVLVAYDPHLLFRQILPDEAAVDRFLAEICTSEWNYQQDLGRSWDVAIAERIARFPEHEDAIRAFRTRWQEMVPGPIPESVDLLEALHRNGVPLYSITNFSSDTFAETKARFPFLSLFRDIVVSAEEGLGKPDPRLFRLAVDRFGIEPQRSLFIDDVAANVEGARSVGLQAVQFTSPAALRADFERFGLPVA